MKENAVLATKLAEIQFCLFLYLNVIMSKLCRIATKLKKAQQSTLNIYLVHLILSYNIFSSTFNKSFRIILYLAEMFLSKNLT